MKKIWLILVISVLSLSLSGCYYFSAKNEMKAAEKSIADLKGAGGEKLSPYEYTSAEKFLENSKIVFGHNDFKAAKEFATRSKSAAQAGLDEVRRTK